MSSARRFLVGAVLVAAGSPLAHARQGAPAADAAAPRPAAPVETAPEAAAVARWEGTLADGLSELARRARGGDTDGALELADALLAPSSLERRRAGAGKFERRALEALQPLLERLRWSGWPEPVRAEVHFARGVALVEGERFVDATQAFDRARALGGPGELRRDATYDLGTAWLLEGERWRARIPELGGDPAGAPPAAGPPGAGLAPPLAGGAPGEEEPDPLEEARRSYLRAREGLVERLRLDWRDADTRANVELVQRRLRELDEIEREREEQQQQQQQQQDQQQDQQPQDSQQDDSQQDSKQDEEQQEEPQDSESQPEEQDQEPQQDPSEQESNDEPREAEERYLTKEEVQRLLDRLRELEEQGEEMRAALRRAQTQRVKRDW